MSQYNKLLKSLAMNANNRKIESEASGAGISTLTWDPANYRYDATNTGGGTINGSSAQIFGEELIVGGAASGMLTMRNAGDTKRISFSVADDLAVNQTYLVPPWPDTSGYALISSDAGIMSWAAFSGANTYLTGLAYAPSTYKLTATMSDASTVATASLSLFGESISLSGTNNGRVNLYETNANGNAYVSLRAPPDMGTDPSYILTLPTTNGGSGQYLISDGLGVLSWSTPTDANYVTTAATFGADGILTGTVGGGGSNWTGDFNAGLHMSSSTANKPHISLTNTTDDNSAPLLDFIKDRDGTAAVSDDLGGIRFYGDDAGGAQHNFARIDVESPVVTAGAEVGSIKFRTTDAGTDNAGVMILSGTKVGIGTTAPTEYLEINSSADDDPAFKLYNSRSPSASGSLIIQHRGSSVKMKSSGSAVAPFIWELQGSEKMRLDDTGLGIGTSAPDQKLHVAGNINIQDGYNLRWNNATQINILGSSTTGLTYTASKQHFLTYNGVSAYTELMTLDDTGVGIGTTSPDKQLHIDAGAASTYIKLVGQSRTAYFGQDSTGLGIYQEANARMDLYTNNTERITIEGGGDVGIGTTAPTSKLHVAGDVLINDNTGLTVSGSKTNYGIITAYNMSDEPLMNLHSNRSGFGPKIRMIGMDTTGDLGGMAFQGPPKNTYYHTYAMISAGISSTTTDEEEGYLAFTTSQDGSTAEVMRIDGNGRVGIGTTSPDHELHVSGASDTQAVIDATAAGDEGRAILTLQSADQGFGSIYFGDASDPRAGRITYQHAPTDYDIETMTFSTKDAGGGSSFERMRISMSGAAISTIAPQNGYELTVGGGAYLSGNSTVIGATTLDNGGGYSLYFKNAGSQYGAIDTYGGSLSIEANNEAILSGASGVVLKGTGGIYLMPTGTSAGDTAILRFRELAANGTASISFKGPDSIASAYTMALPDTIGTATQVLTVDSSAAGQMVLDWADAAGGDIAGTVPDTYIPMASGGADILRGFLPAYVDVTTDNNVFLGTIPASLTGDADQNTSFGHLALENLTTGDANTAVGMNAGNDLTQGYYNTFIGYSAGGWKTTEIRNTAVGYAAGSKAGGGDNVSIGAWCGYGGTGDYNVLIGSEVAYNATSINRCVVIGRQAANAGTFSGNENVLIGYKSGYAATSGKWNTAVGTDTMGNMTTASGNIAVGYQAGVALTTGTNNVFVGRYAGKSTTTVNYNTYIGDSVGKSGSTADKNTAIGNEALLENDTGGNNTAIGYQTLYNTTDSCNVALGHQAGKNNTSGGGNVFIGCAAGPSSTNTDDNKLYIHNAEGTPLIAGDFSAGTVTIAGDLLPAADDTHDIGSTTLAWQDLHLEGDILMTDGGSITAGGDLVLEPPTNLYFRSDSVSYGKFSQSSSDWIFTQNVQDKDIIFKGDDNGSAITALTLDMSEAGDATFNNNVTVGGVLTATAKSFNIPHPLYKDKRLVHGSLEGPEHGLYIRGTIEAFKGCLIELPEYWSAMCEDYTVQLTPHGSYTVFIKEKQKDKVMIGCSEENYKFDYYIVGARTDETLEVVQDG